MHKNLPGYLFLTPLQSVVFRIRCPPASSLRLQTPRRFRCVVLPSTQLFIVNSRESCRCLCAHDFQYNCAQLSSSGMLIASSVQSHNSVVDPAAGHHVTTFARLLRPRQVAKEVLCSYRLLNVSRGLVACECIQ